MYSLALSLLSITCHIRNSLAQRDYNINYYNNV